MNLLALNGGKWSSIEGAVVRFKNLIVKNTNHHVVWVDPVSSRNIYKTEDLDQSVPRNVTRVPGKRCSQNPIREWWAREQHFLNAAKTHDPDVCIIYNAWGTRLAQRHLEKKGIPVVFDYIDLMHAFRTNPLERIAARHAVKDALRRSDAVVATAHKLLEDAQQFNPNAALVPNGVDIGLYEEAKAKKLRHPAVGFIGGFGDWIDFSQLEEAFKHKGVFFYFIGDGPAKTQLPKRPNVFVSDGFVPQEQAAQWVAGFDVCVIPFRKNLLTDAVCPLKLFEYWAASKPVIVSPTCELGKIITDQAIFAHTPNQWADSINRLCHSSSKRKALGQKGFKRAGHYSWKTLSKKFNSVLEDVRA